MPRCNVVQLVREKGLIWCCANCIHGCDYGEGRVLGAVRVLCIEFAIHLYIKLTSLGDVGVIMMAPGYATDAHNNSTMFSQSKVSVHVRDRYCYRTCAQFQLDASARHEHD